MDQVGLGIKVLTRENMKNHPKFDKVETSMIHLVLSRDQDSLPFINVCP